MLSDLYAHREVAFTKYLVGEAGLSEKNTSFLSFGFWAEHPTSEPFVSCARIFSNRYDFVLSGTLHDIVHDCARMHIACPCGKCVSPKVKTYTRFVAVNG